MAIYGLVSYDVASLKDPKTGDLLSREASFAVPQGLRRLGWVSSTKSEFIGDYAQHDAVMGLLRKHLDQPGDVVFPMIRFDERDEKQVQTWVRIAMQKFFDEVVSSLKDSIDGFMERLDAEGTKQLGVSDVTDRLETVTKRAEKKMEDAMVALTTFRLSGEFKDLREAKVAEMDALCLESMTALSKRAPQDAKPDATKPAATSKKT